MRVTRIEIEGYRSIKGPLVWDLAPMNVLIGPNAGGKSNLLRCLELLQQSAKGKLADAVQREGGMGAVVWDGVQSSVSIAIQFSPSSRYRIGLGRLGSSAGHRIYEETFGPPAPPPREPRARATHPIDRRSEQARVMSSDGSTMEAVADLDEGETLLSQVAGPTSNRDIRALRDDLVDWRVHLEFRTDRGAEVREAQVVRFGHRLDPDCQNLHTAIHTLYTTSREFKELADNAMFAAFGEEFEEVVFTPAASQRIELGIRWRSLGGVQPAASLSDGTLRFLGLIAILGNPEPAPLIAIDEPETGLHPGMFAIVAEQAVAASEKSTIILTTHSPQFLDAFESPPATSFVLSRAGETRLVVPSPDQLNYWLEHYRLGELAFDWDPEELA